MHDTNVKTYCTHETNTLPMTDHMIKDKEHQAVRRYLDILKDRNRYKIWGGRWPSFRQRRSTRAFDSERLPGSTGGVATYGKTYI